LDIPAGLTDLPRQYNSFGDFKINLMSSVAEFPHLKGWSGEGEHDLGVMLLDMWAYVLDITQFYDEKITEELFLLPSKRQVSTHKLISLLGYKPRPATSASVTLSAAAGGKEPVAVPAGTAFRSEAFDDEPPQVFETLIDHTIRPEWNRWELKPIFDDIYPNRLLFHPHQNGVPKHGILCFKLGDDVIHASQIQSTEPYIGPDDLRYREVILEDPLEFVDDTPIESLSVRLMGLRASKTSFTHTFDANTLVLDGLYPQLRSGDRAVLETAVGLFAFEIETATRVDVEVLAGTPGVFAPASQVGLPAIPGLTLETGTDYRLHFHPIRIGRPTATSLTELDLLHLPANVDLKNPRHKKDVSAQGPFVLKGQAVQGAKMLGEITRDTRRRSYDFVPNMDNNEFPEPIQTPAHLYGNQVDAIRGEKVAQEVLGSADASQPNNRFKLAKSPLSWVEDDSSASGIRPLLDVFVNAVRWSLVDTLYTAKPNDRVYILETDSEQNTWIIFGSGKRGEPPQTGVGNVVATYYHGAGAAKPPPGTIKQVAKPVKGLNRILNPLEASGGMDAESSKDIKSNAPSVALTLGRAVSVQDFTALSKTYPGVLNVAAGWAWAARRQRSVVVIWIISDGDVEETKLATWLTNMAVPDTQIDVQAAVADAADLILSVDVHPDYPTIETRAAVKSALTDLENGLLSPRNVPIGGVIYRSQIVKAAQSVEGVTSVSSVRLNGAELDWAIPSEIGHYWDFEERVTVA
jgi:hypothetical protein